MMRFDGQNPDEIALKLAHIAVEAGRILRGMETAFLEKRIKDDGTPTTAADLAAEQLILKRLEEAWPGVPVVAEETCSAGHVDHSFFLVDPLDGTGDFIRGTGEYSVNIALIQGQRPTAAVVAAPAMGSIWIAGATARTSPLPDGTADFDWREATVRPAPEKDLVALVSRRHGDSATEVCLSALSIGTRRMTSSALKFCLIASGEADVYVRCGPTMEWDTAAGDHILTRAGGSVVGPGGIPLTYGHEDRGYRNGPFAAIGDNALASRLDLPRVAS
ncbi:3'(2'),5'-bisphosphate nucleotidase CysQ family protein [Microvirga lotononidis]|uniref:3'(2'),5'-bisphosphate nucleotidase CysQ n=1 Tax=Microvirga lotononidis TaxID=864069 RepID=I4YUT1_9HYPH|nr:3'(2'),5'-bisphosphate nucleotidase CysQ [Microvirga lotononidis]EIM27723.1 3'-phosphoadenosine 5'-phosphosulfate (PAPS) 3'-phosphatase [Microvirga lotononidis]WQO28139.1 3'(2'),5'-bisphosphate nucleotidase CysQ [Microvirga lotononidis]